jgi:hypothetical protein
VMPPSPNKVEPRRSKDTALKDESPKSSWLDADAWGEGTAVHRHGVVAAVGDMRLLSGLPARRTRSAGIDCGSDGYSVTVSSPGTEASGPADITRADMPIDQRGK